MAAFSAANTDFDWSPSGNCQLESGYDYYPVPGALELLYTFFGLQVVFLVAELCSLPTDDGLTTEEILEKMKENPCLSCLHMSNLVLTVVGFVVGLFVIFSSENGQDVRGLWSYVFVVATYLVTIKNRICPGPDISKFVTKTLLRPWGRSTPRACD